MRLPDGATSVVTGGGGGLGRAIAVELGRRGGRVVVADLDLDGAARTADLVRAAGGQSWPVACDVRVAAQVEALAASARTLAGEVDLVVLNAGVAAGGAIGSLSLDDWRWVVDVNLWGVVHGCQAFVPAMRARRRGWVLTVASAGGFTSLPGFGPYSVSKAGVIALSETLAAEVADDGVAVTVLCPSFFRTGIADAARGSDEGLRDLVRALTGRARLDADQVARAALDALEHGRLYALPMRHARVVWLAKRAAPEAFHRLLGAGWAWRARLTRSSWARPR